MHVLEKALVDKNLLQELVPLNTIPTERFQKISKNINSVNHSNKQRNNLSVIPSLLKTKEESTIFQEFLFKKNLLVGLGDTSLWK